MYFTVVRSPYVSKNTGDRNCVLNNAQGAFNFKSYEWLLLLLLLVVVVVVVVVVVFMTITYSGHLFVKISSNFD